MSFYAKAGMIIAYLLLFVGSVVLGYYLILVLKNILRSRSTKRKNG